MINKVQGAKISTTRKFDLARKYMPKRIDGFEYFKHNMLKKSWDIATFDYKNGQFTVTSNQKTKVLKGLKASYDNRYYKYNARVLKKALGSLNRFSKIKRFLKLIK